MAMLTSIVAITCVPVENQEAGYIRQPTIIFNIHKGYLRWRCVLPAEHTLGPVEEMVGGTKNMKERTG